MHVSTADVRTTAILPAVAATALRVAAQRERRQGNHLRHLARHAAQRRAQRRAQRLARLAQCHAIAAHGLLAEVCA